MRPPGPLAPLLHAGKPVPTSFSLALSLWDLYIVTLDVAPGSVDFGPFESLATVEMTAVGTMLDHRAGTTVAYDAAGARVPLKQLAGPGPLPFALKGLKATAPGGLKAAGNAASLTWLGLGTLAGQLVLQVREAGLEVQVVQDYGAGAGYPMEVWTCPAEEP